MISAEIVPTLAVDGMRGLLSPPFAIDGGALSSLDLSFPIVAKRAIGNDLSRLRFLDISTFALLQQGGSSATQFSGHIDHLTLLQQGAQTFSPGGDEDMATALLQQGGSAFAAAGDADMALALLQQGGSCVAQGSGGIDHLTLLQQGDQTFTPGGDADKATTLLQQGEKKHYRIDQLSHEDWPKLQEPSRLNPALRGSVLLGIGNYGGNGMT